MTELTSVKKDLGNFLHKTSSHYSINESTLVEMIQAIFFEQEFLQALDSSKNDEGMVVNASNSQDLLQQLQKTVTQK